MENFGVINYLTYVLAALLVIILPGPNSLYVLAISAKQDKRSGWAALSGVLLGDSLLMLATALGAISILAKYPAIFMAIKYAGAAYLLYIGFNLLKAAKSTWRASDEETMKNAGLEPQEEAVKYTSAVKVFNKALLISLLNPKAILFFLSFFVQFVDPSYSEPALPFFILAITLLSISFIYISSLIYAGTRLADVFRKRKKMSAVSGGAVGTGFVLFALKLALASAS